MEPGDGLPARCDAIRHAQYLWKGNVLVNDRRSLIVFDVNETLLDIDGLEPLFRQIFLADGRMREWFAQLILYAQSLSMTGNYVPFGQLGAGVLRMLGQIHDVVITAPHVAQLGAMIADLPVHDDVADALHRLQEAGFTLVTLTNSPPATGADPLTKAGLGPLFTRRFTVDTARQFKPASATYQMVTDAMQFAPADSWLIAAHTWDTIGAQSLGWQAALVTRGVNAPLVLDGVPQPTLVAVDLTATADALLQQYTS